MSQSNKSTRLWPGILFILLMVYHVVNSQQEINTTSKIAVNDSLLLETAETYVHSEDPNRGKSFHICHDILKRNTTKTNKIVAHRI